MYSSGPPTKEASKLKFPYLFLFSRKLQIRERKVNFFNNLCMYIFRNIFKALCIYISSHLVVVIVVAATFAEFRSLSCNYQLSELHIFLKKKNTEEM